MKILTSEVPGFEGKCSPVWLNDNQVMNRLDGGVTGFFKVVKDKSICGIPYKGKTGEEFHGIIRNGKVREK